MNAALRQTIRQALDQRTRAQVAADRQRQHRHRGWCGGCDGPLDEFAPGCRVCAWRACARRARERRQA